MRKRLWAAGCALALAVIGAGASQGATDVGPLATVGEHVRLRAEQVALWVESTAAPAPAAAPVVDTTPPPTEESNHLVLAAVGVAIMGLIILRRHGAGDTA